LFIFIYLFFFWRKMSKKKSFRPVSQDRPINKNEDGDNDNKRLLCLNMIVKNESHIILQTLTNLFIKVPEIDYYVISDTGSTDDTKEIIKKFFDEKGIEGEIHDDIWGVEVEGQPNRITDFGHNRSLALKHAFNKTKYLLIFDADDTIKGNFDIPISKQLEKSKASSYYLTFGNDSGFRYKRTLLIDNTKKWVFKGMIHEFIECEEKIENTTFITGNYYVESGRKGARSQDPDKYLKDAQTLEIGYNLELKKHEKGEKSIHTRYAFYCANSYKDYGDTDNSIKWYKITLNSNAWVQEKYVTCLNLFRAYKKKNEINNGLYYLVQSIEYDRERVECIYELIEYYVSQKLWYVGYQFYTVIADFLENTFYNGTDTYSSKLFVEYDKAEFFLPFQMIILVFQVKKPNIALRMYELIFKKRYRHVNNFYARNLINNFQFYIQHLNKNSKIIKGFIEYISFLHNDLKLPVYDYDCIKQYEKSIGLTLPNKTN
jgi:hypothetical protein